MNLKLQAISAVLAIGFTGTAFAGDVFGNLGAGDTYDTGIGYTISGAGSIVGSNNDQGEGFMSGATGSVGTMKVAMGHVTGTTSVTMRLYNDAAGVLGSQVGSDVVITTSAGSFGGSGALVTADVSGAGWAVGGGSKYWLIADAADDSWHAWNFNNIGGMGDHYWNTGGAGDSYSFGTQGAFDLQTVPEPASMIALGAGLAAIAARRRRK